MALRTDYKDDILDLTQNTKRKYRMITNADGTVSFEDVTIYLQVGDTFGATELNEIANVVNEGSGNIDYFPNEDMIKIKGSDGRWHNWASGGLSYLDVTSISTAYWTTSETSLFSVADGVINLQTPRIGNGAVSTAYAQSTETYKLSNYKTLKLYGSLELSGYIALGVGNISVQVVAVTDGVENVIYSKPITTQSTTINETVALSNLPTEDSNIRIVLNWHNNYTGNLTLSECKFS